MKPQSVRPCTLDPSAVPRVAKLPQDASASFCARECGPPFHRHFATHVSRTSCVDHRQREKNKMRSPRKNDAGCPSPWTAGLTNCTAGRRHGSNEFEVHFPVVLGKVHRPAAQSAARAPIASSAQASTPQIAGFLLYSIAAVCEHRYSTHAYSSCGRSPGEPLPSVLTAPSLPSAPCSLLFPPSCIGNTSIR